ncbi:WcbI family polysaccharide biosynthesis putative acetyltransferase [Roseomonas sp. 18066]|uniref:WcbI family polysaccharide biosynthesis putative acetyltransferase n=1 Tax=Roseomonas sp. 18066 TaxID=2681412 RepID=UPI0013590D86|nr:WcbI family polysaccharide biosynthesis putative acetyltransferase [Roseomonas sp. 18066]
MRILIVGNCQTSAFRDATQIWLPKAEIVHYSSASSATAAKAETIAASLPSFDVALIHPIQEARFGPLQKSALLQAIHSNVHLMPSLAFTGYQPDFVYISKPKGNPSVGPLGVCSSALAAAAFCEGLSVERTVRLFNSYVYSRLGYFSEFHSASKGLIKQLCAFGLDGSSILNEWSGRSFMHTPIHPKAYAISDLCHAILRKLDLIDDVSPELGDTLGDRLINHPVWPVYPELGSRVGVRGCLLFRRALPPPDGSALKVHNLSEFVEASFSHFSSFPAELAEISRSKAKIARAVQFIRMEVRAGKDPSTLDCIGGHGPAHKAIPISA